MIEIGVILAFVAMIGWGFGDFFIQKSTRKVGDWETLFIITFFGAIVLLPFVYQDIPLLFTNSKIFILLLGSFVLFVASLLDLEALKRGKLSIVEPIWSMEIPAAALLAFFILGESISFRQIILISLLIIGLILVALKSEHFNKRAWLERGALIAFIAALFMGGASFLIGLGSRASNALMMTWFLNAFMAIISFGFIFIDSDFKKMIKHYKKEKITWWGMCIFDNMAWIAFAFSMVLSQIAISVAISESYIILTVLIGVYINKERLDHHQKIGMVLALICAVILATTVL